MSKRETIERYRLIIQRLRKSPASFNEIQEYLEQQSELQSYKFTTSKRTFIRDREDIAMLYNIEIAWNASQGNYFIEDDLNPEINKRILEAFDVFHALKVTEKIQKYIHLDKRETVGTENLHGLIHAIQNKVLVKFEHAKYWDNTSTIREVQPLALKEYKSRWYVVGIDNKDNRLKTFGCDRISDLLITQHKFTFPVNFNIEEHFKDSFGIISPNGNNAETVILSFQPVQGRYIKSQPLHTSQQVLIDNDQELRIQLDIVITEDFIIELLSHGYKVTVIEPVSLIKKIKATATKMIKNYE